MNMFNILEASFVCHVLFSVLMMNSKESVILPLYTELNMSLENDFIMKNERHTWQAEQKSPTSM